MKTLYLDQWNNRFYASSVKELQSQIEMGASSIRPMYQKVSADKIMPCGYVIGQHWLTEYNPNGIEV